MTVDIQDIVGKTEKKLKEATTATGAIFIFSKVYPYLVEGGTNKWHNILSFGYFIGRACIVSFKATVYEPNGRVTYHFNLNGQTYGWQGVMYIKRRYSNLCHSCDSDGNFELDESDESDLGKLVAKVKMFYIQNSHMLLHKFTEMPPIDAIPIYSDEYVQLARNEEVYILLARYQKEVFSHMPVGYW